jgi:hypothetical protein
MGKTIARIGAFLLFALTVTVNTGLFTGCDTNTDDGGTINGIWAGAFPGEEYIITPTTFTSTGAYKGTIESIIEDGFGAGYIIIKFTENSSQYLFNGSPINPVGRYYVIHYKNLKTSTVQLSQAYSENDPDKIEADWGEYGSGSAGGAAGKTDKVLAVETYTIEKGYFGSYSACQRQ